jgi:hypothetical protein
VVRNKDGTVVRWQEGANVSLELPGGPAEALALDVEDSWNKSKQIKRIMAAGESECGAGVDCLATCL